MSTKIYDAWRLPAGVDLFEVARDVQGRAQDIRNTLDREMLVRSALELADQGAAHGEPLDWPLYAAYQNYEKEQRRLSPTDVFHDPNRFCLVLLRDPETGDILAKLFADKREYTDMLNSLGWEDFEYWNNTDGPEGISEEDWAARVAAWDRATAPVGNYAHGLNISLSPGTLGMQIIGGVLDVEDVEAQNTPRERLSNLARGIFLARHRVPVGEGPGKMHRSLRGLRELMCEFHRGMGELDISDLEAKFNPRVELGPKAKNAPPHTVTQEDLVSLVKRVEDALGLPHPVESDIGDPAPDADGTVQGH